MKNRITEFRKVLLRNNPSQRRISIAQHSNIEEILAKHLPTVHINLISEVLSCLNLSYSQGKELRVLLKECDAKLACKVYALLKTRVKEIAE